MSVTDWHSDFWNAAIWLACRNIPLGTASQQPMANFLK